MTDSTSANPIAEDDDLQRYQALAQRRLQLEQAISDLLAQTERAVQMPRYRALAQERDEVVSEMRTLEHKMRLDE
jgi:hypothetical protein